MLLAIKPTSGSASSIAYRVRDIRGNKNFFTDFKISEITTCLDFQVFLQDHLMGEIYLVLIRLVHL